MNRPSLSKNLSELEFRRWYWLKSELIAFCREHGVSSAGAKEQIAEKVAAHLGGRALSQFVTARRKSGKMPSEFSLDTLIGEGWRFTYKLRDFFVLHCGSGFRVNEPLRELMATGQGRPLSDAIALYHSSATKPKRPIAKQFEYNRHIQAFIANNPGATHEEAVAAWWIKRRKPISADDSSQNGLEA